MLRESGVDGLSLRDLARRAGSAMAHLGATSSTGRRCSTPWPRPASSGSPPTCARRSGSRVTTCAHASSAWPGLRRLRHRRRGPHGPDVPGQGAGGWRSTPVAEAAASCSRCSTARWVHALTTSMKVPEMPSRCCSRHRAGDRVAGVLAAHRPRRRRPPGRRGDGDDARLRARRPRHQRPAELPVARIRTRLAPVAPAMATRSPTGTPTSGSPCPGEALAAVQERSSFSCRACSTSFTPMNARMSAIPYLR